jgi:hypothetical protein
MALVKTVADLRHPYYQEHLRDWQLWRATYEGGQYFIDQYLQRFSSRESKEDFERRRRVTYNPAFAKEAVDEIKNSIFSRLVDISRSGGSESYQRAITGVEGGIDLLGSSMNSYIGRRVLSELLPMARVGIYVDMPQISGVTIADSLGVRPYVYLYPTEDICNWVYDQDANRSEFSNLLLRDYYNTYDSKTGLPSGSASRYRRMWVDSGRVYLQFYNEGGVEIDEYGVQSKDSVIVLNIPRIPFMIVEISSSILCEAAKYQVALLNLSSADMAYALNSNFPFYVEQFEPRASTEMFRTPAGAQAGDSTEAATANTTEVKVGVSKGRRYPKGMERPGFIHPSPEPLKASMEKQEQMKRELRQLVNLAVTNLSPKMASAESKGMDRQGLESGLSYIGLELENMERKIAEYWSMYENKDEATIYYPTNYSVKTDNERQAEAKVLQELLPVVPSRTYQREIQKRIADLVVGRHIEIDQLDRILGEIEKSKAITVEDDSIAKDVEIGILDLELASELRGYPKGTVEKAAEDHTARLERIAKTQQKDNGMINGAPAARGNPMMDPNPGSASQEKKEAQDTTKDDVVTKKVRGEAD